MAAQRSPRTIIAILFASLALRCFLCHGLGWSYDPWTYRFFPLEIAFFLAGSLAYNLYSRAKRPRDCLAGSCRVWPSSF